MQFKSSYKIFIRLCFLLLITSCGSKSGNNASPGPSSADSDTTISKFLLTDGTYSKNLDTLAATNSIEMPKETNQSKLIALFTAPSKSVIVKINGQVEKGDGNDAPLSLKLPALNIPVEVTAGDGKTKATYILNITENAEPTGNSLCDSVSCAQPKDALSKVLSSGSLADGFTPVNMDCTIPNKNSEDEQYQTDMVKISKDKLTINTKKTDKKVQFCNNPNSSFVSGRIDTANKFNFTKDDQGNTILNGAVEVTAAVPYGKGLWPAIWMLPLNSNWPSGMELDFAEFQSYSASGAPLGTHVHYGDGDQSPIIWNYDGNGADNLFMPNVSDASPLTPQVAHNYGFTWNCTSNNSACDLSWYFDGSKYLTMHLDPTSANSYLLDSKGLKKQFVNRPKPPKWAIRPDDPAAAAFKSWWTGLGKGYYLILNIAVGGNGLASDNQPDWNTFQDASMDVFSIKRYLLNK